MTMRASATKRDSAFYLAHRVPLLWPRSSRPRGTPGGAKPPLPNLPALRGGGITWPSLRVRGQDRARSGTDQGRRVGDKRAAVAVVCDCEISRRVTPQQREAGRLRGVAHRERATGAGGGFDERYLCTSDANAREVDRLADEG